MRNEFYRVVNSHIFYLLIFVSVIAVMLLSNFYVNNTYYDNQFIIVDIEPYEDDSDLEVFISNIQDQINELSTYDPEYDDTLAQLQKELSIYNLLLSKSVSYTEIYDYDAIRDFRTDSLAYSQWSDGMVKFVCLVFSFVFVLFLLNLDYMYKTNINLYYANANKKQKLIHKYLVLLATVTGMFVIASAVSRVFGLVFDLDQTQVLIARSNVYLISTNQFMFLDAISTWTNLLFLSSILFFLSALIRDFFLSLSVNIGFIICFGFLIPYRFPSFVLLQFMQTPMTSFALEASFPNLILAIIFKAALFAVLAILSVKSFVLQKVRF